MQEKYKKNFPITPSAFMILMSHTKTPFIVTGRQGKHKSKVLFLLSCNIQTLSTMTTNTKQHTKKYKIMKKSSCTKGIS